MASATYGAHWQERELGSLRSRWSSALSRQSYHSRWGSFGQDSLDLFQQALKFDRLGIVIVASRLDRFFSISHHRMGGKRDDRNGSGFRRRFKQARRFPTIQHGQAHIHQDQVRRLQSCHRHALFTIQRDGDLVTAPFEAARQHVAVYLIILYQQDLRHPESSLAVRRFPTSLTAPSKIVTEEPRSIYAERLRLRHSSMECWNPG